MSGVAAYVTHSPIGWDIAQKYIDNYSSYSLLEDYYTEVVSLICWQLFQKLSSGLRPS